MVERQPADERVLGAHFDRRPQCADIGEQLFVREHDALRVARAARGVLDKCGVAWSDDREPQSASVTRAQLFDGDASLEPRNAGPEQVRRRRDGLVGYQQDRSHVAEDARLAAEVVLEQRRPARWVQRHRDASRQEHATEGVEVARMSGQHERDGVAGPDPVLAKAVRHFAAGGCELSVGPFDQRRGFAEVEHSRVRPVRFVLVVPRESVKERARLEAHPAGVIHSSRRRRLGERPLGRRLPAGSPHGPDPVLRRRPFREDLVAERDPEQVLHP